MSKFIRIGNAQAFWGDRPSAASDLLSQMPDLDYLTMDYLAEVSMSILAVQRERRPELGYPQDFVQVVSGLADYWTAGGRCRLIANAGGLDPKACAVACQRVLEVKGCRSLKIGVVSGDNILSLLTSDDGRHATFSNLESGQPLSTVQDRLVTANAYLGCGGVLQALQAGADIVITGRVADPSMVLAACAHAFDWPLDDWDRLAQGTIAGHLLECGTQVTGGISTDWLTIDDPVHLGFPVVEIYSDGTLIVTKPEGTGGNVTEHTVKEQLLYEIGDPARYLSPDVEVSFLELKVRQIAQDRVEVVGGRGAPKPSALKVSATYRDGYRAAGMLTIIGHESELKARRSAQIVLHRLGEAGWSYRDALVECLGNSASIPLPSGVLDLGCSFETVMRIAVESDSKAAVEAFSQELMPLVTGGAQGTTGYAEGRPRVHSVFRYWPCLVDSSLVPAQVDFVTTGDTLTNRHSIVQWPPPKPVFDKITGDNPSLVTATTSPLAPRQGEGLGEMKSAKKSKPVRLLDIAYGRSGDKGTGANVGILVRDLQDYPALANWLTAERVQQYFQALSITVVTRYQLPNLGGLNFLLSGVLKQNIRNDAQGKALAQALLAMPLDSFPK